MKILLIGDTSGNPDEGMKIVAHRLNEYLNMIKDCESYFVSVKEVILQKQLYKDASIINFMVGPTWRTFLYGFILKIILNWQIIIVVSFIHPKWNLFTTFIFNIFKPNAVIVQSQKWEEKTKRVIKHVSILPLAGIKSEKFSGISTVEKIKLKRELGLPLDKIILLHVGHLNEGRNLTILNQFKESKKIFPIIIASSTVAPNKRLVNSLIENGVHILNEFIPQIEKYYMASDCYIFPTLDSNFAIQIPLSVIEALSCNLRVLATRYEALPYYFNEKEPFLKYIDSFENLEDTIIGIIAEKTDKQFNQKLLKSFDWRVISQKLLMFYIAILKEENANKKL